MRSFVLGDIHGNFRALLQCLEKSGFDSQADTLIQLGDVADGYPQTYECVETLLGIKKLIAIKGNHDDWLREFCETGSHPSGWSFGGIATAISYLGLTGREKRIKKIGHNWKTALREADIPHTHRQFFSHQRLYWLDEENNLFVHGGFNPNLPLDNQMVSLLYCDRELWLHALELQAWKEMGEVDALTRHEQDYKQIYLGHTPTTNWGTDQPMHALNIINLDTGAGQGGRLTIMDTRTKEYWQSDPVSGLYPVNYRYGFPGVSKTGE